MRKRFFKRKYGQRWQAESGFSRHKRRLGSALTTRNETTQRCEMLLRVLTHNLMILRHTSEVFNRAVVPRNSEKVSLRDSAEGVTF
jgi:hypothetical protein